VDLPTVSQGQEHELKDRLMPNNPEYRNVMITYQKKISNIKLTDVQLWSFICNGTIHNHL
jgi:hypothetical protein